MASGVIGGTRTSTRRATPRDERLDSPSRAALDDANNLGARISPPATAGPEGPNYPSLFACVDFARSIASEFKCPICHCVCDRIVTLSGCMHNMCHACLTMLVSKTNQQLCPLCKGRASDRTAVPDQLLGRLISLAGRSVASVAYQLMDEGQQCPPSPAPDVADALREELRQWAADFVGTMQKGAARSVVPLPHLMPASPHLPDATSSCPYATGGDIGWVDDLADVLNSIRSKARTTTTAVNDPKTPTATSAASVCFVVGSDGSPPAGRDAEGTTSLGPCQGVIRKRKRTAAATTSSSSPSRQSENRVRRTERHAADERPNDDAPTSSFAEATPLLSRRIMPQRGPAGAVAASVTPPLQRLVDEASRRGGTWQERLAALMVAALRRKVVGTISCLAAPSTMTRRADSVSTTVGVAPTTITAGATTPSRQSPATTDDEEHDERCLRDATGRRVSRTVADSPGTMATQQLAGHRETATGVGSSPPPATSAVASSSSSRHSLQGSKVPCALCGVAVGDVETVKPLLRRVYLTDRYCDRLAIAALSPAALYHALGPLVPLDGSHHERTAWAHRTCLLSAEEVRFGTVGGNVEGRQALVAGLRSRLGLAPQSKPPRASHYAAPSLSLLATQRLSRFFDDDDSASDGSSSTTQMLRLDSQAEEVEDAIAVPAAAGERALGGFPGGSAGASTPVFRTAGVLTYVTMVGVAAAPPLPLDDVLGLMGSVLCGDDTLLAPYRGGGTLGEARVQLLGASDALSAARRRRCSFCGGRGATLLGCLSPDFVVGSRTDGGNTPHYFLHVTCAMLTSSKVAAVDLATGTLQCPRCVPSGS